VKDDEENDAPHMLSDSEDEYSETEKILLEKARTDENSDIEESEVSLSSFLLDK
jgi:hypothetical protein